MPGAVTGEIVSVSALEGVVQTERGNVAFSLASDVLHSSDLRDVYKVGEMAVFFVDTSDAASVRAHHICPEKLLLEGAAVVLEVETRTAKCRCAVNGYVMLTIGRLSKHFDALHVRGHRRSLHLLLTRGDRIRYRAMPIPDRQKDEALIACNVWNHRDRPTIALLSASAEEQKEWKDEKRQWESDDNNDSSPPVKKRSRWESTGDTSTPEDLRKLLDNKHKRQRVKQSVESISSMEDGEYHDQQSMEKPRPSAEQKKEKEITGGGDSSRAIGGGGGGNEVAGIDANSSTESAYMRANNELLQFSAKNNANREMVSVEVQTEPWMAKELGKVMLRDMHVIKLLAGVRSNILEAVLDAVREPTQWNL